MVAAADCSEGRYRGIGIAYLCGLAVDENGDKASGGLYAMTFTIYGIDAQVLQVHTVSLPCIVVALYFECCGGACGLYLMACHNLTSSTCYGFAVADMIDHVLPTYLVAHLG